MVAGGSTTGGGGNVRGLEGTNEDIMLLEGGGALELATPIRGNIPSRRVLDWFGIDAGLYTRVVVDARPPERPLARATRPSSARRAAARSVRIRVCSASFALRYASRSA